MFESVLEKKKHFIILGEVVIGTDAINEIANQDWFISLMKANGVDSHAEEVALQQSLEDEARRMKAHEDELRRQDQQRQVMLQQQEKQRRDDEARANAVQAEHDAADAAHRQQSQMSQPPLPPEQMRQAQQAVPPAGQGPQSLDFPYLDITPDKMSPIVWDKLLPQQQQEWQAKYNV